jgi:hypothetical protein
MHLPRQTSLLTGLFLWSVSSLLAQTTPNPSGHWEGAIQAPKGEVRIEVDVAQDSTGALTGTFSVPFSLTRTGDARIDAPPKSAPIGKELEGNWNGTLDVKEKQLRIVLTMSNHAAGTSTGSLVNLDEGALEIPVGLVQKAASLTVDVKANGGSFPEP